MSSRLEGIAKLDAVNLQTLDRLVQTDFFLKLSRYVWATRKVVKDKDVTCVSFDRTGDKVLVSDIVDVCYLGAELL